MIIPNGATGVSTYWVLRDSTNHVPTTGIAVTGLSLSYVKEGFAISDPVSASGLASASADYTANNAFELGKGWYRIDWPDIFDGGIGKKVFLTVEAPSADTAFREVELSPSVNISYVESVGSVTGSVGSVTVTTGYSLAAEYDAAKTAASQSSVDGIPTNAEFEARTLPSAQYVTSGSTIANVTYVDSAGSVTGSVGSIASGGITSGSFASGSITNSVFADDVASTDDFVSSGDFIAALEASGRSIYSILEDTTELQTNQTGWLTATGFAVSGDAMTLTAAYDAAKTAASQTTVNDIPTNAEFEARTLPSAQYVTTGSTIAGVIAVTTTTGYSLDSDYDSAKTAASQASVDALPTTGDIKTSLEAAGSSLAQILTDTNELQQNQSGWLTATGFTTSVDVSGISTIDTKVDAVSGYVDEIESRLTATRAGYLDNLVNLDTTVGSRAPSATALSTAVWTNTKAGYIDTTIGSRLASASYTTPPTTGDIKTSMEAEGGLLNSINSKTTNLPSDPADQSTLETLITSNALTAADVWAYATRTITSGGVTPQQIWEYATRTITSGGVTAQQIWEYTTRTITSGGITAQDVWEYVTRTITAGGLTSGEVQAAVALALVAYEAAKTGDQMDLINVPNASAVSVIQSGLATATNLNLVKQVTDKVDTALELDGDVYRFTTNSLEMIPAASAEITAENIENIRIEIDTNSTKLAEILEDTSTSIPSAISSIPTGETITAEEIVTELLTTDYTSSTGTNTIGKWINAVRTLLGHKSVENTDGTEVSFKNDDESETEAGTQTWNNTTKTRGKYTGW